MADLDSPLAQSILKQVEYYFSRQNLQSDHYLVSKMNPQLYVPLEVVAGFKMLRNITTDLDLIKRVLRTSTKLQLDESGPQIMVRPYLPSAGRTTIILRDIPKDVKIEEIKAIFPNSSKIVSVRPDIEETWFVTFESEQDCKEAYSSTTDATFRGNPVKARIKSENLLKSFIPEIKGQPPEPQPPVQPPLFMPAFSSFGAAPVGLPYPFLMSGMAGGFRAPFGVPPPPPPLFVPPRPPMAAMPQGEEPGDAAVHADVQGDYGRRAGGGRAPQGRGGRGSYGRGGPLPAGDQSRSPKRNGPPKTAQPAMSLQDFPPLPTSSSQTRGYTEAFKRFSKAEIIAVLSTLQNEDVPLPQEVPQNCLAVSKEPIRNIELLRTSDAAEGTATGSDTCTGDACARPRTFAEAAITEQDIKAPEKVRRPAGKPGAYGGDGESYEEPSARPVSQRGYGGRTGGRGRGGRGGRSGGRRGRAPQQGGSSGQVVEVEAGTQTTAVEAAAAV